MGKQYAFGSGTLFGVDASGSAVKFGGLQDINVDFSFTNKELRGQKQIPLTIARGAGKITGKAKAAQISGQLYNSLFFGLTLAAGQELVAENEAGSIPVISTYIITVANAATFVADLGVSFADGTPLTPVVGVPTTGQYAFVVATGIYTFAAADEGKAVLISYKYTAAATGKQIVITNQVMGTAPYFMVVMSVVYSGQAYTLTLNKCISSKLTMATKLEDFMIPEIDFEAMDDGTGSIGTLSMAAA